MRSARVVLCALAAMVGISAPAHASTAPKPPAAAGGIGLRLVDAPVSAGNDPRARVYIVDHLAPGTVIDRRIEVSNTTDSVAHVVLYAAAATIVSGAFVGAAGATANDLSTWTSVGPSIAGVPAGGLATANVSIAVPLDAAPGEQYGVVWAEARTKPVSGAGVVQVSRVGIRLYVSVGPGGPPAADFTIDSVTAARSTDDGLTVAATVRNTGGRALDMSGTLELLGGPGGLRAGPFVAVLGTTLAIGATESVTFSLDKQLPRGPWDVRLSLYSGLIERTAQATITFPKSGTAPPTAITHARPGWMGRVVIGFGVLAAGAAALIVRGRRVATANRRIL